MGIELLLDMALAAGSDRVLLGPRDGGHTAAQLDRLSRNGALELSARGVRSVAFIGVSSPILPITLFSAARAGIRLTPLNYRLAPSALGDQIARLERPLVIADRAYRDSVARQCGSPGVEVLATDEWSARLKAPPAGPEGEPAAAGPVGDDDVAVTLFTSGTTSAPKEVLLRHRNLTSYVLQTVEFGHADADDAALVSVPPYHVAGVGTILTNLYAGRRLVYLPNFSAPEWVRLVAQEQIRSAMVVPTMLARIVDHLEHSPAELPTLRSIAYGGAPMPRPTLERALRRFGDVAFTNAYGLTETSSTIAVLTPEDHRRALAEPGRRELLSSAGRLVPGVEGVVRSPDGAQLPAGVAGELWVRGAQVSGEYQGLGSVLDEAGWFPTRDLAHLDEEGYVFVHGRVDDTIIRGGENIAPNEIEEVLVQHPAVREVAVVGVPDEEWGHRIRAVVVLDDRVPAPGVQVLRSWVRDRLRGSRTPDEIVVAPSLPYSPTGKLLRRELLPDVAAGRR